MLHKLRVQLWSWFILTFHIYDLRPFLHSLARSPVSLLKFNLPIQFSDSVVSDSFWPHGLQHTGPPCPSLTPGACLNSCPSSWWFHATISSSVVPFSSCLQCFPASGSFPMSQFSASGGQIIGASALASVLPMNIQDWFPLGLSGLIFLQSKGLSRVFSKDPKDQFFGAQLSFRTQLTLNFVPYLIQCAVPGVFFKCEPSRKLLIILLLFLGLAAM